MVHYLWSQMEVWIRGATNRQCWRISHIALLWNSQTHSVNDTIYDFDWVFLEIPVKIFIVGVILTCPIVLCSSITTNNCLSSYLCSLLCVMVGPSYLTPEHYIKFNLYYRVIRSLILSRQFFIIAPIDSKCSWLLVLISISTD